MTHTARTDDEIDRDRRLITLMTERMWLDCDGWTDEERERWCNAFTEIVKLIFPATPAQDTTTCDLRPATCDPADA